MAFGDLNINDVWNAATNTPILKSGKGLQGKGYLVSVPGNTILDGVGGWLAGDIAIFLFNSWVRIPTNAVSTSTSVNTTIVDPLNLAQFSGVADCTVDLQAAANRCFGSPASPNGNNAYLNQPLIIPPGQYNISSPIQLRSVKGGLIQGAGRFATNITNTANGEIFQTNGFEYTRVQDMHLQTGHPGTGFVTLFNLDWYDGSVPLQSNTFHNIYFEGGDVGVGIGYSGQMGSENLFLNCYFNDHHHSGMFVDNFNALQNAVIGGNFAACVVAGIYVAGGAVPVIHSVGFQNQDNIGAFDIIVAGGVGEGYHVAGCRSESVNFIKPGLKFVIEACNHIPPEALAPGYFCDGNALVTIEGCSSRVGKVRNGLFYPVTVNNSTFVAGAFDECVGGARVNGGDNVRTLFADPSVGSEQTYLYNSTFNCSNPVTITVPSDATQVAAMGAATAPGVTFTFINRSAGGNISVVAGSGATLLARGGLHTANGQNAVVRVTKVTADTWSVSGDLA